MKVEFYKHAIDEQDIANAAATLRSVFLTTGPVCARFEQAFAQHTGLRHCVALNSCTGALHLALLALGVGPGDEVITTPMTFIATATAILHTGATPVFVDIKPETGLIDPEKVEAAVTPRTKAILPVHLYGVMADMRALRGIADRHGLHLVEDSAHCIEGERDGIRPGQLSDATCYSFYATKNLTCGEGGALCCNSEELAAKILLLRQHGMNKEAALRYHGSYQHWDMVELGWKYNLSDIQASLLLGQLDRIDGLWAQRQTIHQRYSQLLSDIRGLWLPHLHGKSAYHLLTIQVHPTCRDELLAQLTTRGIGVAVNYRSVHTLIWFRQRFGFRAEDYPLALRFGEGTLSLPFHTRLTDAELRLVAETVREFWGHGMR